MFQKIYGLPIWAMLSIAGAGAVLWLLTAYAENRRGERTLQAVLLAVGLFFILYATLLREQGRERVVVLMPFAALRRAAEQPENYRSLLLNCLMFLPFSLGLGGLLPQKWSRGLRIGLILGVGMTLSLLVETMQYVLALGWTETDDVLANTLGCGLGAGLMCLRDRMLREKETEAGERS